VINEDPTDKLIRELKEENEKLKEMLAGGGKLEKVKTKNDEDEDSGDEDDDDDKGLSEEGTVVSLI